MSDIPDSPSSHALLCHDPAPVSTEPHLTEIKPTIPASTDTHADTPPTMGNQQSGEGSLRRRNKKKSKNKDDKTKIGIASALFNDPVLGASGMVACGGTSVDEVATPSKRKKQTEQPKSPRPIRSTYDNVNQSGSITSLCDPPEMYNSDLFLDTVSRLDVSMTASQADTGGVRHFIDPQTIDNLSYGGSSLTESGFITPALATPQVKRNQLAGAMTTSDSVTELGKEIERAIFERLSANQKSGNAEGQSEASLSSSPKPNEVKMTMVVKSPIPPRKTVTEVKLPTASPRTAKLEFIKSDPKDLNGGPERVETKPLKPVIESKVELDLRKDEPDLDEKDCKSEIIDETDKADNELMEKDCKLDAGSRLNPDDVSRERMETKNKNEEKHEEPDVNLTSSSSDDNCGDFEKVKLHIEEDDFVIRTDQEEEKTTSASVDVKTSSQQDIGVDHSTRTSDQNPDQNTELSVIAAGQQSALVNQNLPKVLAEKEGKEKDTSKKEQFKPADKETETEMAAEISDAVKSSTRETAETSKQETTEKGTQEEKTEQSESVFISQVHRTESSEKTVDTAAADADAATVTAAAVAATKPLELTVRTVVLSEGQTEENSSVVETPEPVCEQIIQAADFASVEQARVIMRRPVFQIDQDNHDIKTLAEMKKAEKKTGTEVKTNQEPEIKPETEIKLERELDSNKMANNESDNVIKLEENKENTEKQKPIENSSITYPIILNQENLSTEPESSLAKEQFSSETEIMVVASSNNDGTSAISIQDIPKDEASTEKSNEEVTSKTSKSKKDRKRKNRKGRRKSLKVNDVTTETQTKETPEHEDTSSTKEDNGTVSSREEETGKSTTDESSESSGIAFDKQTLQQQRTVIERAVYKKDGIHEKENTDDKSVDACDLFLQSEEFKNQDGCAQETPEDINGVQLVKPQLVAIDTQLTVESPASSEILSDEPTPTNDRCSQLRAFYIPDPNKKNRSKIFGVADNEQVKEEESERIEVGQQVNYELPSEAEGKINGSSSTSDDKNKGGNEPTDNVVAKDYSDGTKTQTGQKRNQRISMTSEEVLEIFQNSQTSQDSEVCSNSKATSQEAEDDLTNRPGLEEDEDAENNDRVKLGENISNLTLSDIDSSLPETLPELADLQNFLEYIKFGERPTESETPPFSPRAETGRSSPNENSNSRRLSRISPAVTDRSVTESDLDISEQRDDLSTDSNIFADDEDESSSELLFTKTYTEPDKGGEVCVSCTVVNTNADDDSDEFWAENSASEEVYRRIETSTKAVTTVFDNARLQMQDIHLHLHNLRLQMESLQESLDNACILSQEYYNMDNDQVTSQDFHPIQKGFLVSQEYFSKKNKAPVTTEEYSPVDIGPVLTEEYYSSTIGKPGL